MRKQKKHSVADSKRPFTGEPGKSFSAQSDFSESENRPAGDDGKTPGNAKKEISGAWILLFLLGLLILLVVQHWFRQ
jgi:hypothetical protein